MNDIPISIVIPTLGYECLNETVSYLNNGPNRPKEIIVVIPEGFEVNAGFQTFENVIILKSPLKGQVKQRIFGFKYANEKHILQLDDDIWIDQNNMSNLLEALKKLDKNSAVAPAFLKKGTSNSVYIYDSDFKAYINNLVQFFVLKGAWGIKKMGKITFGGINFGVNYSLTDKINYPCDWLAGGCVLHHADQVYLDNFYPFEGKAYCEDLFHSFYLKRTGINLYSNTKTFCYLDWPPEPRSKKEQNNEHIVLRHFIKLSKRSIIRFTIFCYYLKMLKVINFVSKYIFK